MAGEGLKKYGVSRLVGIDIIRYHLQRYRHRFSLEVEPLYYFALGGRKNGDVPASFAEAAGQPA